MDTQKQSPAIAHESSQLPPAQLWIGDPKSLIALVHNFMQLRWCTKNACNNCSICKLIIEHQYHKAIWVAPSRTYVREDLDIIFQTIQFALDESAEIIFVLQKADELGPACYNSLLKSIEEPPAGYHFLLLAQRIKQVAPTIRSRCIISHFSPANNTDIDHPLAKFFLTNDYIAPHEFARVLELAAPDENETKELLELLLVYWAKQYTSALKTDDKKLIQCATSAIELFQKALLQPPMPGSSALFWKNLFVQFKG